MSELKPCPFCGGKARWSAIHKNGVPTGVEGYECEIYCHKCKKGVKRWALRKNWAIASAIEAWNRRVSE